MSTFTMTVQLKEHGDPAVFNDISMGDISLTLKAQDPSTNESVSIVKSESAASSDHRL